MELVGTRSSLGSVIEPIGLQHKCIMSGYLERKRRCMSSGLTPTPGQSSSSSDKASLVGSTASGNSQSGLVRPKSSSKEQVPSGQSSSAPGGWKKRFFTLHSDLNLFWYKDQEVNYLLARYQTNKFYPFCTGHETYGSNKIAQLYGCVT